jgi:hypothetical protein
MKWRGKSAQDDVNLIGWIATGGDLLAPLKMRSVFEKAEIGNYGSAVQWDDGDLAIDAAHLMMLANEQRDFNNREARNWQKCMHLSNNEVADLLSISLSTWNAYKAGNSDIPPLIGMACRAMLRDPVLMQAHYRPRKTGRPRQEHREAS